jgi:hypothetical protein
MATNTGQAKTTSTGRSKTPTGGNGNADYKPLKICFERILPEELDTGRGARLAIRELLGERAKKRGGQLSKSQQDHVVRMSVRISKKWPPKTVVRCHFLDGSATMRAKVEKLAHEWEKHENVKFKFVGDSAAQIRISFVAGDGSWSAVGTDALNKTYFPADEPTMNYGWLRDGTSDEEYRRVVLHEFGHALGCIHEHEAPTFTRKWNKLAVYEAFSGPPNKWTKAEIDSNVLHKYSPKGLSSTEFDPKSIMLYEFPAELFSDGKGPTNENTKLSVKDIGKISEMYPK